MDKLSILLAVLALACSAHAFAHVDSKLLATLDTQHHANIIITMKDQFDSSSWNTRSFASRADKITTLRDSLVQFADKSQNPVVQQIHTMAKARSVQFKSQSFWITNQVFVEDADAELVQSLLFRDDVARIDEELIFHLDYPQNATATVHKGTGILLDQWGVVKVRAPTVWTMAQGTSGRGVIVGVIDTGARHTHTILSKSYAGGSYSWYDAISQSQLPRDDHGHGTHVTGSIAGSNGYGVAPDANWISCKAFGADGNAQQSHLIACFEFMLCPTNPSGASRNCSKAPHIVNNSWSRAGGSTVFNSAIQNWHNAGIVPVFANGNEGEKGCRTGGSPADQHVIAVGATTNNDALASFSSKGPTTRGTVKPDVSAPGYNIQSASHMGDALYVDMSGTSMASPHVSGVLALLLSYKPDLTYSSVKDILQQSAVRTLAFKSETCGEIRDSVFPNNHFGYGRIDAYAAALMAGNYVPTTTPGGASQLSGSSLAMLLLFPIVFKLFM